MELHAKLFNAQDFIAYKTLSGLPIQNQLTQNNYDGTDTDWSKVVFGPSFSQQHTITFQGGNTQGHYFTSLNVTNNNGIVRGDRDVYKRITAQINGDYNIKPLAAAIDKSFGSFDAFKEQFTKAAVTLFGSGWAWLVKKEDGSLEIVQESNAGNPLKKGLTPVLTCDVWEHSYYVDYQNRRADFVSTFWELVDWSVVEKRY